jgi:YidC/Oxa1 family membrane protein insertase
MSPLAVLDPAVALAHDALAGLAPALEPLTGDAAVAVALVVLTLAARALLLPLAVRVHRAEGARRALAPEVERLRRRHRDDPARLAREVGAVHRAAGVSPFAGLAPSLAQAPVLLVVYRMCVVPVVAGAPNVVFTAQLFGAPLSMHAPAVVVWAGVASGPALVVLAVLLGLVAVAVTTAARMPDGVPAVLRVLPFGAVAVALFAPMALALHLLASTTWTLGERIVLPRLVARAE